MDDTEDSAYKFINIQDFVQMLLTLLTYTKYPKTEKIVSETRTIKFLLISYLPVLNMVWYNWQPFINILGYNYYNTRYLFKKMLITAICLKCKQSKK